MENLVPFLFMGCWNREGIPRNHVTKAIRKNKIKNLVLGGDNLYSNLHSDIETLHDGLHMLRGKMIYASLGNHDIGPILEAELDLHPDTWILPNRYYSVHFDDYSLIVGDSNVTHHKWLFDTIDALRKESRPYYYVQHHPFVSFETECVRLYTTLCILSTYPPITVLCSHIHQFQRGVLCIKNIDIPQMIVGTGGAMLHSIPYVPIIIDRNVTYVMEECIEGYGYLQISNNGMTFIKVD